MDTAPNARVLDENGKPIAYDHVGPGDCLKILYKAERGKGWIDFNPAYLMIWLNGQPLKFVQEIKLSIGKDLVPNATITFNLEEVDIDASTLLALHAILDSKEAKKNGETVTEAN